MTALRFPSRHLDCAGQRRSRRNAGCRRLWRRGQRYAGPHRLRPRAALAEHGAAWLGQSQAAGARGPRRSSQCRIRKMRAGVAGQRHHHRPLGDGGHSSVETVSRSFRTDFRPSSCRNSRPASGAARSATAPLPAPRSSQQLGEEHVRTGKPIVYTSADSVFQVAAHEEVIPLWELYKICETAREMLRGPAGSGTRDRQALHRPARLVHAHAESQGLRGPAAARHAAGSTSRTTKWRSSASAKSSTCSSAAALANTRRPKTIPTGWRRRWRRWTN